MIKSLQSKLLISLIIIAIVAVAVAGLSMRTETKSLFNDYVRQGQEARSRNAINVLASYYLTVGSWKGVQPIVVRLGQVLGVHVIVADAKNVVVGDSQNQAACNQMFNCDFELEYPIILGADRIGKLYVRECAPSNFPSGLEQDFLHSVNRSLIWTGIIALLIAIALGLFMSRRITAPVHAMTMAVRKIQGGDLSQRALVTTTDEVGELSEAFNQMADGLQKTEQLRRDMIADIAHELRTPLTTIRGNIEAMQDAVVPLTPESLSVLHEETLFLNRLIDDLRDLSLAEAGQLELKKEFVNISDLITREAELIRTQASERGIEVIISVEAGTPPIPIDIGRISQVLKNLLSNALRFTPPGGQIKIEASSEQDELVIHVKDTGSGIAAEDLPYIFERFYRADKSRTRSTGGAGIGLTITKRFVEAHGGRITASSEPGHGSTFTVFLPYNIIAE